MTTHTNNTPSSLFNCFCNSTQKFAKALFLGGIFLIVSTILYAGGPVKSLSNKALKKIEEKYDKETRSLFSGKNSDKNVLALKRLIAEGVDPDLAITAIKKFNEAKKYRSGSVEKRKALALIEDLFVTTNISWKKVRDTMMGAGGAIAARKSRTVQKTYTARNKPSCRSKTTISQRAPKVKYQDPDRLAESAILMELTGNTSNNAIASL